jgi:hypothetical protein
MKFLIMCDGVKTRVYDADTGELMEKVRKVTFSHEAGGVPIATLEIIMPDIDLVIQDPEIVFGRKE